MTTRILIYGESWKNTMADLLGSALRSFGHEVSIFDFTQHLFRHKGVTFSNRVLDRVLKSTTTAKINSAFRDQINSFQPNLVVVSKGIHIFPETIDFLKGKSIFVVNWNPDDFFNPLNSSHHLLSAFGKYDIIFTARSHLRDEYLSRSAQRVEVLQWYYDPSVHFPPQLTSQDRQLWSSDISFIGSWSRHREEMLSTLKGMNLKIWGGQWEKARKSFRMNHDVAMRSLNAAELPKVIAASKININIQTVENRDRINLKNFEIPACQGFLLTERTPELKKVFSEDADFACYESVQEMKSQCLYFLANEETRKTLALRSFSRVVSGGNTMSDRAKQLMSAVQAVNGNG